MDQRQTRIDAFLERAGLSDALRHPLPGDASTRHYVRLITPDGQSLMLMDQAPSAESQPCSPDMSEAERRAKGWNATARLAAGRVDAFIACADYLRSLGLSAPRIFDAEPEAGLAVIEDLGDGLFARLIEQGEAEAPLYLTAIEAQARLHGAKPPAVLDTGWPLLSYDEIALQAGADLFIDWFPKFSGQADISETGRNDWHALWKPIVSASAQEARVFIHRDYHAENLLWLKDREGVARIGMIDFQDALLGSETWDLHSLLQDARRDVPEALEAQCLDHYFSLRPTLDQTKFLKTYRALAALNEARIIGIFARLVWRDHKPRYESFMPRMWRHLSRNLNHPDLADLKSWFIAYGYKDRLG